MPAEKTEYAPSKNIAMAEKPHDKDERRLLRRRHVLGATGVGLTAAIAGCGGSDDSTPEEEEDKGEEDDEDDDHKEADTEAEPDDTEDEESTEDDDQGPPSTPTISDFTLETTGTTDTLHYEISIEDTEADLKELEVHSSQESLVLEPDSDDKYTTSGTIAAHGGTFNDIDVTVKNEEDGSISDSATAYTREFDVLDSTNGTTVAPHYLLFMGIHWDNCNVGTPEAGRYEHEPDRMNESNREAFERHIDQMQGHGIDTVTINWGEEDLDHERLDNQMRESDLIDQIDIEISYPIVQVLRRDRDVEDDMEYLAEFYQEHDNLSTIDGRPVVYLWGFEGTIFGDQSEKADQEYGGADELARMIRESLTVDGTEPYIIGNTGHGSHSVREGFSPQDKFMDAVDELDAIGNWFPDELNEEIDIAGHYVDLLEAEMDGYQTFTDRHGLDYIPVAAPGFDARNNDCWGEGRYAGRSEGLLEDTIELAEEYGTEDHIMIATWNDWVEGTQIEPGSHKGEDYGISYLDVIKDFRTS